MSYNSSTRLLLLLALLESVKSLLDGFVVWTLLEVVVVVLLPFNVGEFVDGIDGSGCCCCNDGSFELRLLDTSLASVFIGDSPESAKKNTSKNNAHTFLANFPMIFKINLKYMH